MSIRTFESLFAMDLRNLTFVKKRGEENYFLVYAEIIDGEAKGQSANVLVSGDPNVKGSLRLSANFLDPVRK